MFGQGRVFCFFWNRTLGIGIYLPSLGMCKFGSFTITTWKFLVTKTHLTFLRDPLSFPQ